MLDVSICMRCEKAPSRWDSFLCQECADALNAMDDPNYTPPPVRPEQGVPVVKRKVPRRTYRLLGSTCLLPE